MTQEPQVVIPLEYARESTNPLRYVVRVFAGVAIVRGLAQLVGISIASWGDDGLFTPFRGDGYWYSVGLDMVRASMLASATWLLLAGIACMRLRPIGRLLILVYSYACVLITGALTAYLVLAESRMGTPQMTPKFLISCYRAWLTVNMFDIAIMLLFSHRAIRDAFAHTAGRFR